MRAQNHRPSLFQENRLTQIPCITRNRIFLIPVDDVEYIHTDQAGNHACSRERCGITELTLKLLQERTPLVRCHRQYLVNLREISEIELLDNGSAEAITRSANGFRSAAATCADIKNQLFLS